MSLLRRMRIGVAIATSGRPEIIRRLIAELARQTRPFDSIYVCAPAIVDIDGMDDIVALSSGRNSVQVILGVRGSCCQRNAMIARAMEDDILLFLDDDFVPHRNYAANLESIFSSLPDVVVVTGHVVADGIIGPGLIFDDAQRILSGASVSGSQLQDIYSAYGCNMAVRLETIRKSMIRFDERLPLYGWLEDEDFSRALALHGRVIKANQLLGVHLGYKSGRQAGRLLGYSQIANPIYLARKGTISRKRAMLQLFRNIAANCWHAAWPESYVDRVGRLRGHFIAISDMAVGRLDPRRVLEL